MCELGVFLILLENDLLNVNKILGLTFLRQEKTWKDSKRCFSIYCSWVLWSMDCLQLSRGRFVNSAFPNKKNLAQKSKFIYDKHIWKQMFAEILRFK